VMAGRLGTRIAAASVNLADSSRHQGTLPRSFDAEGVPRQPVPLIQDGVAHRPVLDTAAAHATAQASTGHATRPCALAPYPEHLVLAGGGAKDEHALMVPVADGLFIPAIGRDEEGRPVMRGAVRIRTGALAGGVDDRPLDLDPLAVLASVEELTARQSLLPLKGHCPGGIGAALVPALRAREGVRW
jgi:predicted Zn-dependent protease